MINLKRISSIYIDGCYLINTDSLFDYPHERLELPCSNIEKVIVTHEIDELNLYLCNNLKHVTIFNNINILKLEQCNSLETLIVQADIIDLQASSCPNLNFQDCKNLETNIYFEGYVKSVNLFGCKKLESAKMFKNSKSINLNYCDSIKNLYELENVEILHLADLPYVADLSNLKKS